MSTAISRMQFLRGDFSGKNTPIRPPWAVDEFLFTSICDGCGECISQCPVNIIEKGRGNFPVINFASGDCDFCGDCVDSCKSNALNKINGEDAWSIRASLDTGSCLAYNNVECRGCYDPCEARAINITPRIGGVSIPVLNTQNCTGCGACFAVCPTRAISIQYPENS